MKSLHIAALGTYLAIALLTLTGCRAPAETARGEPRPVEALERAPLYDFDEGEVDRYLRWLSAREPDLLRRVVHLARKNLGQPYEIYLLGEFPFELYDPDPLYALDRSDCVVFVEQTYAMALAHDWPSFLEGLLRIRYKDGKVGVETRNHFTEADWNPNNAWLVRDLTAEVGGVRCAKYEQRVDRARSLKKTFGYVSGLPVETHADVYIPSERVAEILDALHDGDLVEIVKGRGAGRWVGHVGLFVHGEDGSPNFLHSAAPRVREEPLLGYLERGKRRAPGKRVFGIKVLRLRAPDSGD